MRHKRSAACLRKAPEVTVLPTLSPGCVCQNTANTIVCSFFWLIASPSNHIEWQGSWTTGHAAPCAWPGEERHGGAATHASYGHEEDADRLFLEFLLKAQVTGACGGLGSGLASPGSRRPAKSRLLPGLGPFPEVSDGRIYVVNVSLDPLLSGCLTWTLLPGDRISAG